MTKTNDEIMNNEEDSKLNERGSPSVENSMSSRLDQSEEAALRTLVAENGAKISTEQNQRRLGVLVLIVAVAAGVGLLVAKDGSWYTYVAWAIGILAIFYVGGVSIEIGKLQAQIEGANAQLVVSTGLPSTWDTGLEPTAYFESLVKLNTKFLTQYYFLVKQHASGSFWTALAIGVAGFMLIALGLGLNAASIVEQNLALVSVGAGLLTEFIAAIFFFLYNSSVRQLKEYHNSLLKTQNALISLTLIESVDDDSQKTTMMNLLLTYLLKSDTDPILSVEAMSSTGTD